MRFVTALVLMALLLGAGGARPGQAAGPGTTGGTSTIAAEAPSGVSGRTVEADRVAATSATGPGSGVAGPADPARVDAGEPTDPTGADAPASAVGPVAPTGRPVASGALPGGGAATSPTGDAYPRTSGSRAPPTG
ncbi:hypothetical protein [Plantactinospora sp. B24E8]|uniref:hypothetical protein n=1 Tax=Plantactinospora sp. B24E8 TaxID=3153567 RepID=UPI00325CF6A6